jgi:hypothetical protein
MAVASQRTFEHVLQSSGFLAPQTRAARDDKNCQPTVG